MVYNKSSFCLQIRHFFNCILIPREFKEKQPPVSVFWAKCGKVFMQDLVTLGQTTLFHQWKETVYFLKSQVCSLYIESLTKLLLDEPLWPKLGCAKKDPFPHTGNFPCLGRGGCLKNIINLYRMSREGQGGIVNFLRGWYG